MKLYAHSLRNTMSATKLLPNRLGHQALGCLQKTVQITGFKVGNLDELPICSSCAQYKGTTVAKPTHFSPKTLHPFHLVGSNVWTPSITSIHGYKYTIGFSNHHSGYTFATLLMRKPGAIKDSNPFVASALSIGSISNACT